MGVTVGGRLADRLAPPLGELGRDRIRWRRDPLAWIREVVGAEPYPWQVEALRALGLGRHVAVRSGHGVGKSQWLAWAALWWLDCHDEPVVPCAAPTFPQLTDHLWPRMADALGKSEVLSRRLVWQSSRIFVRGRERTAFAAQRTAGPESKPENLAGFHAKDLLFLIDEASGVADQNMSVVQGALTTQGARLVMAGNPTRSTGFFADRFVREEAGWYTDTVSCEDAPGVSQTWVADRLAEWGREADQYRIRVLGLPPQGNAEGYLPYGWVERAMGAIGDPDGPLVLGVDVARYGPDETVIAARRGSAVVAVEGRYKAGNDQVAAWVLQVAADLRTADEVVRVVVDADGVGGGVADLLRGAQRSGAPVKVIAASFGAEGDEQSANSTAVWWRRLRERLRTQTLSLPTDAALLKQLTDRTYAVNLHGKVVLESKDHMRSRGVASPDRADAVVLTLAGGNAADVYLEHWKRTAESPAERLAGERERAVSTLQRHLERTSPSRAERGAAVLSRRCAHIFRGRQCRLCGGERPG